MFWLPYVVIGILIDAVFIVTEYKKKPVPAVILKGLASLVFVLLGFACFAKTGNRTFGILVVLGLIFGAMGDVLLNLRNVFTKAGKPIFIAGMAVFLLGHLMYLAALILLDASVLLIGVPVAAVLSFLIIRAILKRADAPESIRKVGTFYLAAVIAMFSCALGLFIKDAASPFCQVFVI